MLKIQLYITGIDLTSEVSQAHRWAQIQYILKTVFAYTNLN